MSATEKEFDGAEKTNPGKRRDAEFLKPLVSDWAVDEDTAQRWWLGGALIPE